MNRRFGLFVALMALGLVASVTRAGDDYVIGKAFPDFKFKDVVTGKEITLKSLRGHVVLIDYWATWCGPCKALIPDVVEAHDKYAKKGLVIISISLDNKKDESSYREFIKEHDMNWLHEFDGGGWKNAEFVKLKRNSIPQMIVLDGEGKIIHDGAIRSSEEMDKILKPALAKLDGGKKDLAAADKLRDSKQYVKAIKMYERVIDEHKGQPTAKTAEKSLAALKADKNVAKVIMQAEADSKAPQLIKLGDQLVKAGKPDKARKYYQQVVEKYPGTKYADQAKRALEAVGDTNG